MRPTAGRWVSGDDSFDREGELRILESHVRDHNHLLLTGQRRMGSRLFSDQHRQRTRTAPGGRRLDLPVRGR